MRIFISLLIIIQGGIACSRSKAQEKSDDNLPAIPKIERRLPPPGGLEFPVEERKKIERRLADYEDRLWEIGDDPHVADVGALTKAVDFALKNNEFYHKKEFSLAGKFLELADQRFAEINDQKTHSWTGQRGLVVRGYLSSIDESFQPFGLEIPENLDLSKPAPLLVWLHGRGDKSTDIHFLQRCMTRSQAFGGKVPDQRECLILYPFGRQCIGWKHAGEIDIFEAIAAVKKDYRIDPERIALAGFSMGGAGAWHVGAHYNDQFCAVHAGAGFAETARYNQLKPETYPPEYEQRMWKVYDVPNYIRNFLNGPVLAYAGEVDKQKQSSDLVVAAFAAAGGEMPYLIGPGMPHRYHDASVKQIWQWLRESWAAGNPARPDHVEIQTPTLRYAKQHWLQLTGLKKHWEDSRASAQWDEGKKTITVATKNVVSLEITEPGGADLSSFAIEINGKTLRAGKPGFSVSSLGLIRDAEGNWGWGEPDIHRKHPGLQGPIDDAFLSRFIVVGPDNDPANPKVARWVNFELNHFRKRWRELLRGKLPEESAGKLDSDDMDKANLILWGDPDSNPMIAEIADRLPVTNWTKSHFTFRGKTYNAVDHVPLFVFPNPVNPERYIVINSGHTFREDHDRTNSLQNPKFGDWAIIDLNQLPNGSTPGKVVAAGVFDENWK